MGKFFDVKLILKNSSSRLCRFLQKWKNSKNLKIVKMTVFHI